MGGRLLLFLSALSLIWSCATFQHVSFTIKVRARKRECFYDALEPGDVVRMEWQVVKGGDIDFFFTEPDYTIRVVHQRSPGSASMVNIEAKGEYEICLDNTFSTMTDKLVFFSVDVQATAQKKQKDAEAPSSPLTQANVTIEDGLVGISEKLHQVTLQQEFFQALEAKHRYLLESNNSRVLWWSVLECTVMVVVSAVQVMVIRSLFQMKRKDRIQT